eukprot:Hpha_TRINITY_DN33611_c0_g1::TRINITY_DN33611_c0_g1_i1::g.43237::m.43237
MLGSPSTGLAQLGQRSARCFSGPVSVGSFSGPLPGWNRPFPPSPDGSGTLRDAHAAALLQRAIERKTTEAGVLGRRRVSGRKMDEIQADVFAFIRERTAHGDEVGVRVYNIALGLFSHWGRDRPCLALWREMKLRGVSPDTDSWTYMISAQARKGDLSAAERILEKRRQEGHPDDVRIFGVMIQAAARSGDTEAADRYARQMQESGEHHTEATVLSLIGAPRSYDSALQILKDANAQGVEATTKIFTALIQKCARAGVPEAAEEVFEAMRESGLTPDVACYTALLSAYGHPSSRIANLRGATQVWSRMERDGINPSCLTWCVLISVCWRAVQHATDTSDKSLALSIGLAAYHQAEGAGHVGSVYLRTRTLQLCGAAGDAEKATALADQWYSEGYVHSDDMLKVLNNLSRVRSAAPSPRHTPDALPELHAFRSDREQGGVNE